MTKGMLTKENNTPRPKKRAAWSNTKARVIFSEANHIHLGEKIEMLSLSFCVPLYLEFVTAIADL